jgi:integrase
MNGGPYGRGNAPERTCMKLAAWPETDRAIWLAALRCGDFFEEGGARAAMRPRTNRKIEKGYGRYLTFLSITHQLDPDSNTADRITPERVNVYVRHLQALGNGSGTILCRLQELGDMAKVLDPARNWSFINRIASGVRAGGKPVRDKRSRLVTSEELFELGLRLMGIAESDSSLTPRKRAILFRDGLIIALLALRPIRRRNLAGLALGVSVRRTGDGWLLHLEADDTKTHVQHEIPWPDILVRALETYLAQHRPVLMGFKNRWHAPIGNALWVSSHGSPLTQMALYDRIIARTREAFGRSVNPHLFRDCAATTLAIADPVHVGAAAPLLGHRSSAVTEKYYQQAKSLEAHRMFTGVIFDRLHTDGGGAVTIENSSDESD